MDKAAIALEYSVPALLIVVGVVVILKLRTGGRYGRISTRTASVYLATPAIAIIVLLVLTATSTTSSAVPFLMAYPVRDANHPNRSFEEHLRCRPPPGLGEHRWHTLTQQCAV